MYRYYTINEPKDGTLDFPGAPAKTHSYGQNGVSFECVRERVYDYAEYAEELDAQTVEAHRLIAGPVPAYYPINEDMARCEKEMMSFSDYRVGSKTEEYRRMVDNASLLAAWKKARTDPMYHEKVDRLAESYARRLAANTNDSSRIGASCPSVMIAGLANFPVRKKQKQVAATERSMSEWNEIQALISKIKSVGMGGISSDDPQAVEKLKAKLDRLVEHQELMKAANAAIRMKDTEKGDAKLAELGYTPDEIKQLRKPDFCGCIGYPSYALTNNNANIKRIRDRIAELEKLKSEPATEGWEFNGGQVVVNIAENRLQIVFDEKPDADLRAVLKGEGFRWSPSQRAWQRQLTDNAFRAARRIKEIAPVA
jgi:hypothetical protein